MSSHHQHGSVAQLALRRSIYLFLYVSERGACTVSTSSHDTCAGLARLWRVLWKDLVGARCNRHSV